MPLIKRSLITTFLILVSFASQGQSISDFEKLVRKNTRKASKTSVRKKIEKSYSALQYVNIKAIAHQLNDSQYTPDRQALSAASAYNKAKVLFKNLYGTTPVIEGENSMLQKAGLELESYYSNGLSQMSEADQTSKIFALSNLKFVQALDPNYKKVEKLVNDLNDQISYNVLIKYNLEGFEELEPTMFQLNTVLVNEIKAFGGDKVDYYFDSKADPNMEFHYTITLDFEFIQVPLVSMRIHQINYSKIINKVTVISNVEQEIYERNINATGTATVSSLYDETPISLEPFNIKLRTKSINSILPDDKRAIDSMSLRRMQNENATQSSHQKSSDDEFRKRMFDILRRQIQEIESYF